MKKFSFIFISLVLLLLVIKYYQNKNEQTVSVMQIQPEEMGPATGNIGKNILTEEDLKLLLEN